MAKGELNSRYLIGNSPAVTPLTTTLSRECPVDVVAVELREERVEGRQRVLRELGRRLPLQLRGELGQLGAQRRGPALRARALFRP